MAEIALQCLACYIIADFLSGLGHWFEDTYGLPDWPILGNLIIKDNLKHHKYPTEMSETVWLRNYHQVMVISLIILTLWLCSLLYWQVFIVGLFLAFSNETHGWCHGKGRNAFVIFLQEMGLVITPINHGHHHRSPYAETFCVMTNWVNPILDRIQFWRGMEWVISLVGIYPKRLSKERDFV